MKKTGYVLLLVMAITGMCMFTGCMTGKRQSVSMKENETDQEEKLKVVSTLFPYYDFARQIGGEEIDLTMVIPAGMDSHSFEPTPKDMIVIQNADLVLCNGGEMERWVEQVLEAADSETREVLCMMDYVDAYEEEIVEGMEHTHHEHEELELGLLESENEHEHEEQEEDDSLHIEYDEHIWTSPANAILFAGKIGEKLQEIDPKHADLYKARCQQLCKELKKLDQEFRDIVDKADQDAIIFADKFPFRYFAEEFGLRYYAAFSGCSSDTEPSAKTIAFLIDKVKKEKIGAVYYLELSSPRVAQIIEEETGAKPFLFHSCHNVTRKEFDSGITYLELMRRNEEALKVGLWQ